MEFIRILWPDRYPYPEFVHEPVSLFQDWERCTLLTPYPSIPYLPCSQTPTRRRHDRRFQRRTRSQALTDQRQGPSLILMLIYTLHPPFILY